MSVKSRILFLLSVLLLIHILILRSGLRAEKGFRFGTWTYGGKLSQQTHDGLMDTLANILKFNYLMDTSRDSARFEAIERNGLRIAAQNITSGLKGPYFYSHTHYNVWEAEGNEAFTESLNLQHPAGVGSTVADGEIASYKVTAGVDPETLIQFGPLGYAQDLGFCGVPKRGSFPHYPWIDYYASYRIRAGPDLNPDSDEKVAILYVARVIKGKVRDILDMDTLWDSHFPDSINYIEHTLKWNTKYFYDNHGMYATSSLGPWSKAGGIELRVHWFGKRDFYIDKVTVYDRDGFDLIEGRADNNIYDQIYTHHQNSASLDAWYMREEMACLGDEVDCVKPWKYVRSYLAEQGDKWGVGSMAISKYAPDFQHVQDFLDLVDPDELWVHSYLLQGEHYDNYKQEWKKPYAKSSDYQGPDSLSLQVCWDSLITELSGYNELSRQRGINYTSTLQGHSFYTRVVGDTIDNPDDTLNWYYILREPTGYELECMSNLALAYGSKGVMYWKYFGCFYKKATVWIKIDSTTYEPKTDYCYWIINGITDTLGVLNDRWHWIEEKIGPYMEKLGPIYYDLAWQGAGSSDELGSITGNFMDSIESYEYPDSSYIEIAFFDSGNTDYFMLINRRCLEHESQNVTSYVNKEGDYLIIDLYEDDTTLASYDTSAGVIPFITHLDPGEGKLFKLVPR